MKLSQRRFVTTCALLVSLRGLPLSNCAPLYNYNRMMLRKRIYEPGGGGGYFNRNIEDVDYWDDAMFSSSQKQIQIASDDFSDLSIAGKVSAALATFSVIGLSYLSCKTTSSDLQVQIDTLRQSVNRLQYSVNSLQNSLSSVASTVSSLSNAVASLSGVSSSVLSSTCNTLKSITSVPGPVASAREIETYLRSLINIPDPVCS